MSPFKAGDKSSGKSKVEKLPTPVLYDRKNKYIALIVSQVPVRRQNYFFLLHVLLNDWRTWKAKKRSDCFLERNDLMMASCSSQTSALNKVRQQFPNPHRFSFSAFWEQLHFFPARRHATPKLIGSRLALVCRHSAKKRGCFFLQTSLCPNF